MTGRECIEINATALGLTRQEILERLEEIVAFAELADFISTPCATTRRACWRASASRSPCTPIPICCSSTRCSPSAITNFQDKCIARIEQLRNDGVTILFVSHDPGSWRSSVVARSGCAAAPWWPTARRPRCSRNTRAPNDRAGRARRHLLSAATPHPGERSLVGPGLHRLGQRQKSAAALRRSPPAARAGRRPLRPEPARDSSAIKLHWRASTAWPRVLPSPLLVRRQAAPGDADQPLLGDEGARRRALPVVGQRDLVPSLGRPGAPHPAAQTHPPTLAAWGAHFDYLIGPGAIRARCASTAGPSS